MSGTPITIVGNYASPYVRKVLVCLDLKGIPYQIDPIIPFFGNDEFSRLNPVRRIPLLIDGDVVLPDSTVICEYLEERFPGVSLYPNTLEQRAKARWLEEYADSCMGEIFIWRLFGEVINKRYIWRQETDDAVVQKALTQEIPDILNYLEKQLPAEDYLFESISVADIAIATFFRNAELVQFRVDATRWPITAAFVDRLLNFPSFVRLRKFEEIIMTMPLAQQRESLKAAGAPIADKSFGTTTPRKGILSV